MKTQIHIVLVLTLTAYGCLNLSAQNYRADRLKKAVQVAGLRLAPDSIMPEETYELKAKDGQSICVRTNPMGEIEHVGIPLFNDIMRLLQPSPVYDFLEYALLNWKYKVNPNQLYLSKVIFKLGNWNSLLIEKLNECDCSIENREDKLYIVTWKRNEQEVAIIGIPIDYELLNNDTRRNMEQAFVRDLSENHPAIVRPQPAIISESDLNIYGTEGLFVVPGASYIIELLNQNIYYKLATICEKADTIIRKSPVTMTIESVMPVIVNDPDFPAETFANLMMCDDNSVPDVTIELDFHLSNYHRQQVTIPLSQFKAFCRQNGCNFYFACDGVQNDKARGIMFASNLPKGYNHLLSLHIPTEQLYSASPVVHADVYLYIPPIEKSKLLGTAPTKKSGINFNMP